MALLTVFLAVLICFCLLRVIPGDPARTALGPLASDDSVAALQQEMGLSEPIVEQFRIYAGDFLKGDWGFSYATGVPVRDLIGERIMATLELAIAAFVLAFFPALGLALAVTYRDRPVLDRLARSTSFLAIGTPAFLLAVVGLMVASQRLGLFPGPEGRLSPGLTPPPTVTGILTVDSLAAGDVRVFLDAVWHLLLPALCMAFLPFGFLFRLLRANLLDVRREPFLIVVRSKGVPRWTAFARHALPNAFLPTLTASGLILADLLAGSVLVETIFAWPGVGALVVNSIQQQDYSVPQAFIVLTAVAYVLINTVVDILYGVIDPRTRLQGYEAK
jgi:peptide/nickel transport system permease protein